MVGTVCIGIIGITGIAITGVLTGHDTLIISLSMSAISGMVSAVVAHYKTKARYQRKHEK